MNKSDAKWFFGILITLVLGIWRIWTFEIKSEWVIPLIKLIYTLFLAVAIFIAAYLIVFKREKKNAKR